MWLPEESLLVQLLFRKICCEYKNYVFLVVLKSYFASLRVVTSIMYFVVICWKCFYETCFFIVFAFY